MRNTLPPLLQQFVPPLFQLRGDGLNPGGLFDGSDFNVASVTIAKLRVRELYYRMCGAFVQPFAELFQNFNSVRSWAVVGVCIVRRACRVNACGLAIAADVVSVVEAKARDGLVQQ